MPGHCRLHQSGAWQLRQPPRVGYRNNEGPSHATDPRHIARGLDDVEADGSIRPRSSGRVKKARSGSTRRPRFGAFIIACIVSSIVSLRWLEKKADDLSNG